MSCTPGQWRVHHNGCVVVSDHEGKKIVVADCRTALTNRATAKENARLIAAAPELLAACKVCQERLRQCGLDWLAKSADPVDAAIAKAEGTS